jgi:hypothetical protein
MVGGKTFIQMLSGYACLSVLLVTKEETMAIPIPKLSSSSTLEDWQAVLEPLFQ